MNRIFTSTAILIGIIIVMSPAQQASQSGSPETPHNLLYVIPGEQLGTNELPVVPEVTGAEIPRKSVKVFRFKDFEDQESSQSTVFSEGWVMVPLKQNENLYRLVVTKLETPRVLSPLRIDTSRFPPEELTIEQVWPEGKEPKSIMMKWAQWWQTETNATPVVLVLIEF